MKHHIFVGNVLDVLKEIPDQSVDCCVTSPPYWGLRNYSTEPQIWGGDQDCRHEWTDNVCLRCGAWLGELGLEPTPEMYVSHLVEVFNEVYRVLKETGTLWLNLGDSYAGSGGPGSQYDTKAGKKYKDHFLKYKNPNRNVKNLKPKDLVGIPWMVAFALRDDGWYLRSDIIWEKVNCLPESVKDRPTRSHEYIFLLSKNKKYYYDIDAIREPYSSSSIKRINQSTFEQQKGGTKDYKGNKINTHRSARKTVENFKKNAEQNKGRNKRTVWTIPTKPFRGAHFATFNPALIEPCILAGSPEGGIVLDPFGGSGTVALVCEKLNRNSVYIDLKPEYAEMAINRLKKEVLNPGLEIYRINETAKINMVS